MQVSTVFSSNSCATDVSYFNLIQGLFRAPVRRLVAPSEGECGNERMWTLDNVWKYFDEKCLLLIFSADMECFSTSLSCWSKHASVFLFAGVCPSTFILQHYVSQACDKCHYIYYVLNSFQHTGFSPYL